MDFFDFFAVTIIIAIVLLCSYLYYRLYLSEILIKWQGIHTTGVVLESKAAQTRAPTASVPRYAHFITYEFTDAAGNKWTNTKTVRRHDKLADVVKGAQVAVYYMLDRPEKNVLV